MKRTGIFITIALAAFVLTSCWKNVQYEKILDIEEATWQQDDTLYFEFEITDTTVEHTIFYDLRYTINYPYKNLYIYYALQDSSGKVLDKNLQRMSLFDHTGKPHGSSIGDTYDYRLLAVTGVKFPYSGKYVMAINQEMRVDALKGMDAVGIRIEQNE